MRLDLLLRELQAGSAAITFPELAPLAHQLQQAESLARRAAVDLRLGLPVAELGAAANSGPCHLRRNRLTPMVQRDRPEQRRSDFIRQQAGRSLAEHRRVERCATVGCIKRGPAAVRLKIDRIAWRDESCHISDRVGDHELTTQAAGDVQRLIKITRTGRIDGDQFQIRAVKIRKARLGGSFLGGGLDFGRKVGRHLGGCPNGRQALRQFLGHDWWQSEFAGGHDRSLTARLTRSCSRAQFSRAGRAGIAVAPDLRPTRG